MHRTMLQLDVIQYKSGSPGKRFVYVRQLPDSEAARNILIENLHVPIGVVQDIFAYAARFMKRSGKKPQVVKEVKEEESN